MTPSAKKLLSVWSRLVCLNIYYFSLPKYSRKFYAGIFDEATKEQMSKPRCGNSDTGNTRPVRYAATSGWGRTHVTWNVVNYTQDLTTEQVDDAIRDALKV